LSPANETSEDNRIQFAIGFRNEKEQLEWFDALTNTERKQTSATAK